MIADNAWSNYQKYGILAQGYSCSGNNFKCFKFYTSVVGDTKSFFSNDYITKSVLACPSLLAIQALKRFMNLVLVSVASFFFYFFSLQYLTCKILWFFKPSTPSNKLLHLRINRWLTGFSLGPGEVCTVTESPTFPFLVSLVQLLTRKFIVLDVPEVQARYFKMNSIKQSIL